MKDKQRKIIKLVSVVALFNFFLFISKYLTVFFFDSISVLADSYNSGADFIYSLILLIGVFFAFQPKDKSHPHGHERIKPFLSLIVAVSIFFAGITLVQKSIFSFLSGGHWQFTPYFILVLSLSIGIKAILALYLKRNKSDKSNDLISSLIKDCKSDFLASASALVGVIGSKFGYLFFDPVFALIVSIWVFRTAIEIGWKNIKFLIGSGPSQEIRTKIKETIEGEDKVELDYLEAHYVGPKLHVYCRVLAPGRLELEESHQIEEKIKSDLSELKQVDTVYVHLEPKE